MYEMPCIGQESFDDTGDKYSYREPNQRVHLRKYFWKFTMAKCQQIDMYIKPRSIHHLHKVGISDIPGPAHDYDPAGWSDFEDDAVVLREFWNSLRDYPNLWFDGEVSSGPGGHQYVLSADSEAVAYCSLGTAKENVSFDASNLRLTGLATDDGSYTLNVIDPATGVV